MFFLVNPIVGNRIQSFVNERIEEINSKNKYEIAVESVDFNLFKRSISLQSITVKPSDSLFSKFKQNNSDESVLKELSVTEIDISGVRMFDLLVNKKLNIGNIIIEASHLNIYRPQKEFKVKGIDRKKSSSFSLDSIRIKGLYGLKINDIEIDNYGVHVINISTQDTLAAYLGKTFQIEGVHLEEFNSKDNLLVLNNESLEVNLSQQSYDLSGGIYRLSYDDFKYSYKEQSISASGIKLTPKDGLTASALKYQYSTDVFDAKIASAAFGSFDLSSALSHGVIAVDNIVIDSLELSIFKNKTKPWNTDKRPLLPNQLIKNLNQPLHINKVSVLNSDLYYSEQLENTEEKVNVNLNQINIDINYITSLNDSTSTSNPLEVDVSARLLDILPVKSKIVMPYDSPNNMFYFSGNSRGTTPFVNLNPITFPALGMKFSKGHLTGMSFNVSGSPNASKGEMTMTFKDLEVDIFKKDLTENKTVSWLANTVVKSSNPNNRGTLKVAEINFDRVMYKGFGNYLWKSIESGIVNSVIPFGKRHKKK